MDVKATILARTSFNSGYVQVIFKIYVTNIGNSVLKSLRDFLKKVPSRNIQNRPKITINFCLTAMAFLLALQRVISLGE